MLTKFFLFFLDPASEAVSCSLKSGPRYVQCLITFIKCTCKVKLVGWGIEHSLRLTHIQIAKVPSQWLRPVSSSEDVLDPDEEPGAMVPELSLEVVERLPAYLDA